MPQNQSIVQTLIKWDSTVASIKTVMALEKNSLPYKYIILYWTIGSKDILSDRHTCCKAGCLASIFGWQEIWHWKRQDNQRHSTEGRNHPSTGEGNTRIKYIYFFCSFFQCVRWKYNFSFVTLGIVLYTHDNIKVSHSKKWKIRSKSILECELPSAQITINCWAKMDFISPFSQVSYEWTRLLCGLTTTAVNKMICDEFLNWYTKIQSVMCRTKSYKCLWSIMS